MTKKFAQGHTAVEYRVRNVYRKHTRGSFLILSFENHYSSLSHLKLGKVLFYNNSKVEWGPMGEITLILLKILDLCPPTLGSYFIDYKTW